MKKYVMLFMSTLILGIFGSFNQVKAAEVNNNKFLEAYLSGVNKGIINSKNMSKEDFIELCKDSVFPAYLEYTKDNPQVTFEQYVAMDNYEVPKKVPDDNPTTVRGSDENNSKNMWSPFLNLVAASNGYSMKAGDILICYGTNTIDKYIGHAAIATSANYILEMPGYKSGEYSRAHNAHCTSKKNFFKKYANGKGKRVEVYRIKQHPKYADVASTYAYRHMYKQDNPYYQLPSALYDKSHSYCSKYVYLAYRYGAKASSVKTHLSTYQVPPYELTWEFSSSFTPAHIHTITQW